MSYPGRSYSPPSREQPTSELMTSLSLSPDAVTVLGLAGSALPFAQSIDDEVERWLRPLRLYGESGRALQSLGISEAPLDASKRVSAGPTAESPDDVLHDVTIGASRLATERGATTVGTSDILLAVMEHYGDAFESALRCRSSDSLELIATLAERTHTAC
jgi:hypothetical protein